MNEETKAAVRQWRAKAQDDWSAVEILLGSGRAPEVTVCFHCQQYVEKLLKALLTAVDIEAPRTHNLTRLIHLCLPHAPELEALLDQAPALTFHGVQSRYPDDWRPIEREEMMEMVELARRFGAILKPRLEAGPGKAD